MNPDVNLDVVILAAGKGTRMRSARAKVLHELAGRPLLHHVIATARELSPRNVAIVVGHQADAVRATTETAFEGLSWVEQHEQLGTGHAVQHGMQVLPDDGVVLVLYGDVPLARAETLQAAVAAAQIQDYGWGTIVGEETGEFPSLYASIFPFFLPETGIRGTISKARMVRINGSEAQEGVMPDIVIRDHLLDEEDEILEGLLERLR